jgi:hypothetical protein
MTATPLTIPPRPVFDRGAIEQGYRLSWPAGEPCLLGCRGWFLNKGITGQNDRGLWDDAIFLVTPNGALGFNANTDPSTGAPGRAELAPGVWRYRIGIHGLSKPKAQRYKALVQAAPVSVRRDGRDGLDTGWFGINIHRGGSASTGSAGCQTIPPSQWAEFLRAVEHALWAANRVTIAYHLGESI